MAGRPRAIPGIVLCAGLIGGCESAPRTADDAARTARIEAMYAGYREEFPQVESIRVEDLGTLDGGGEVVFVDVRTDDEVAVSRIPGAMTRAEFESSADELRDATIVTYCTIGYRSGLYADDLRQRGFDVLNLEGSILAWTHSGEPLVDEDGETREVHVYGRRWDLAADGYQAIW